MVAFNFSPEHAPNVAAGIKTQTIRSKARGRYGDAVQLYTGQRTRDCIKLMPVEPTLIVVDYVAIRPGYLTFGNPRKHPSSRDECAQLDGFKDYPAMVAWFQAKYSVHSFIGYLHRWALPYSFTPNLLIRF